VEEFLGRVGRTKYVRPLIQAMRSSSTYKELAEDLLIKNADRLHSSTLLAVGFAAEKGRLV